MLDQRRRRWADVVQMVYKCFVFAGTVGYNIQFIIRMNHASPANTRDTPNVGLLLGRGNRRWTNIKPSLGRYIVFAVDINSRDYPVDTKHL